MTASHAFDLAKVVACLVVIAVAGAVLMVPFVPPADLINSIGHLADNGYPYLWVPLLTAALALAILMAKSRWTASIVPAVALFAIGIGILSASHSLRGDAIAYGSDRNEQWAMALENKPYNADVSWLLPESVAAFRDGVNSRCCRGPGIIGEQDRYPVMQAFGLPAPAYPDNRTSIAVGAYTLEPGSALHDYISIARTEGDWLAYYAQCVVQPGTPMTRVADSANTGAAESVAIRLASRSAERPVACQTADGVKTRFGVDLKDAVASRIEASGGKAAEILAKRGLADACKAHHDCAQFQRDFAVSLE
ncbi:hypothetical protein [Parvibaculum sp.]|uniref:hypothetical protein n=1 Tax=Parvibaculum sp. TaxID=2024848 RepID=UPI001B0D7FE1|nr:hypothetical protein [Parvibaculum sp.]MBO6633835.1 hypothetical protein [Parvibaculum sp.]MBO6678953.1 hypothetical protein [Parvibaculum sp.]MBO6686115.1 hypothetical protein [Parvibaculum sp.]MBO6903717.1 hypothetical protein [Parvibaculum sp.]